MGSGHDHDSARRTGGRRLKITLGLVVAYTGAEVVGGLLSGSLALLADAGHMLSDAASLALALFAVWIVGKPGGPQRSFGFHRTEILAALANGAALVAIAVFIVIEAARRLAAPPEVDGSLMLLVAIGGLVVNLVAVRVLHGGRNDSLNLRGAWLHVLADTLGSVQAIAAGAAIRWLGWQWADPVASVLIAGFVVWSAWSLLRAAVNVLMEAAPGHIDPREVQAAIAGVDGVVDVHDLHVWTITSGFESLSAHVRAEGRDRDDLLADVHRVVHDRFGIEHSTFQVEAPDRPCVGCDGAAAGSA